MVTIRDLLLELLGDICGLLIHIDALRASLVCRSWRDPPQRALFTDVVLGARGLDEASLLTPEDAIAQRS